MMDIVMYPVVKEIFIILVTRPHSAVLTTPDNNSQQGKWDLLIFIFQKVPFPRTSNNVLSRTP